MCTYHLKNYRWLIKSESVKDQDTQQHTSDHTKANYVPIILKSQY